MDSNASTPHDGQRRQQASAARSPSNQTKRARWLIALATFALTGLATVTYVVAIASGGINALEAFSVVLFAVLFVWIAFSFVVATIGWATIGRVASRPTAAVGIDPQGVDGETNFAKLPPTAVLVPVYNEAPDDVFARIEAMMRSLATVCEADTVPATRFDFFVLSDSTNTEVWLAEELAWSQLNDRLEAKVTQHCQVFYRHRVENRGRKAGNIADFCQRWSSPYHAMVVLDADSLMAPGTMLEMVRRMVADDRLGILQVPPVPTGRSSLFARLQQFSAQAYGPVFVQGFAAWAGDQGNYWGHNAIIRVAAFCECCDLPVLPGQAPLGGEILSHDFVEASLLVRRGWKVRIATDLAGSFEECPTTLADYAMRDQRWCQGNLQHSRLILSDGFHAVSRMHFLSGVMAYVASPLWILFTVLCVGGWVVDRWARDSQALGETTWFAMYGRFILFAAAMALLLIPKFYGVVSHIMSGAAKGFGGRFSLAASASIETLWSILMSPLMAVLHSRFVLSTLLGRNVRWSAQNRNEHGVTLGEATRDFWLITLLGTIAAAAILEGARPLAIWFIPILAGLVFAIPIAMMLGSRRLGVGAKRLSLLLIPQEVELSPVHCQYHAARNRVLDGAFGASGRKGSLFSALLHDPTFFLTHQEVLSASESNTAVDAADRDEILRLACEDNLNSLSVTLRRRLLSDASLLRELHIRTRVGHSTSKGTGGSSTQSAKTLPATF